MTRTVFFALALLMGCHDRPQPLGKLPTRNLELWAHDCATPVVAKPWDAKPDPLMVGARYHHDVAFAHAVRQYECPRPGGFSLFVGADERLVGVCVDEKKIDGVFETAIERAERLLRRHFDARLAERMLMDLKAPRDRACNMEPERLDMGLLRWNQTPPAVRRPDGGLGHPPADGTYDTCCWEVLE